MHKGHEYIKCPSRRVISNFIITQFYPSGNKKIRPTQSKTEIGCRGTPNFVKAIIKCIERCKISSIKKAMTDDARHGEWLVEVTGLEPTASASRTQRSTKLSHTSKYHCNIISHPSNLVKAFFSVLYPLCSFLLRWPLVYDEFIEIILIVTYFHWHMPCVVILYI